jgi:hypothetical protein
VAKRKPIPAREDIDKAFARARKGEGRQLALMIKAVPADALIAAISLTMKTEADDYFDTWLLKTIISCSHASQRGRAEASLIIKKIRKECRTKPALNPA